MSLHGPASHLELFGNFGVVTALQKQFDDFLFARSQADGLLVHHYPTPPRLNRLRPITQLECFHFL